MAGRDGALNPAHAAYQQIQQIARDTVAYLRTVLCAGMTLTEVREICEAQLYARGADSFWYWDIGAFVFAGDETAVSVSGRTYRTSDRTIAVDDIVTVDLSPQRGQIWGDFARTLILEDGRVQSDPAKIRHPAWRRGLLTEARLHTELSAYASPETTFSALWAHMNQLIQAAGYENCDLHGNLGHSIEREKDSRIYIEQGNQLPLSAVSYFTFEPHISLPGAVYGYKMENIYYFADGVLHVL